MRARHSTPVVGAATVVAASHLAVDLVAGGFTALLPTTAERLSLSDTAIGALVALFSLAALASQPLMGGLADRFDPRRVTAVTAIVAALILATVAVAPTLTLVLAIVVVGGLASAAFHPAGATLARRADPVTPAVSVAWFSAAGTIGLAAGPVAVLALADRAGDPAVLVLAAPAVVVAVLVWRRSAPLPPPIARVPAGDEGRERGERGESDAPVRMSLRGSGVPALAAAATLVAIASTTVASTMPLWIADGPDGDATDPAIGWSLAAFSLATAAGGVIGGRLATRHDPGRLVALALLGAVVPMVALATLQPGSATAVVALVAAGVLSGPAIPVLLVAAQDLVPARAATAAGMIMGLSHGLAGVAFLGVAQVIDVAGHGTAIAVGAVALLPAAAVVRLRLPAAAPDRPAADQRVVTAACGCVVTVPVGC